MEIKINVHSTASFYRRNWLIKVLRNLRQLLNGDVAFYSKYGLIVTV
jgi:hypothetical protein